ncbi:Neuralized-like protein 2 [Armadillidium nasatum]|uniref:Neuralized-like protein 2 n=1 Tax=Armadillidium nasatum TaxID=96803 RepID=A0A5N5TAU3_9CRUS|nr:Neuralized-like protein 2 [Armadillidium nasatum]
MTSMGKKVTFRREILPTDEGSRIGVVYLPKGNLAEMHYIINGEDQGAFTRKLPYKDAPLFAVVDVYGATKQVRIIQLYGGVASLKKMCRTTILRHIAMHGIKSLPLPRTLKEYLLYET